MYENLTLEKIERVLKEVFENVPLPETRRMVLWSGQLRIMYQSSGCFLIRGRQWHWIEYYCTVTKQHDYDKFFKETNK